MDQYYYYFRSFRQVYMKERWVMIILVHVLWYVQSQTNDYSIERKLHADQVSKFPRTCVSQGSKLDEP